MLGLFEFKKKGKGMKILVWSKRKEKGKLKWEKVRKEEMERKGKESLFEVGLKEKGQRGNYSGLF